MGKSKQKHAYDQDLMNRLKGVALPQKLKCSRCERFLLQSSFSAKQLTDARKAVQGRGPQATYRIKCQGCTNGTAPVEIECCMCGITKGIDDFAKAQSRKPDQAKCFECMEEQLAQEPIEEEAYEDPRKAYVTADTSGGKMPNYWDDSTNQSNASEIGDNAQDSDDDGGIALSRPLGSMSLGSNTGTLIDSDFAVNTYKNRTGGPLQGKDGWATVGSTSWHTKSTGPSPSSGLQANKYGNPATSSAYSISGPAKTFNSTLTERSDDAQIKNGWAKVKAYKKPFFPPKEPVENEWSSGDEEDDDDASDGSDGEI